MGRAADVNYYIQLDPGGKQVRVHVNSLKPHLGKIPQQWQGYLEQEEEGGGILLM
jgi:hypothetical protein